MAEVNALQQKAQQLEKQGGGGKVAELCSQNHKLHEQIATLTRERDASFSEAQGLKELLQERQGERSDKLEREKDKEKLVFEAEIVSLQAELMSQRGVEGAAEALTAKGRDDRARIAKLTARVETLEGELHSARQTTEASEGQVEAKQKAVTALNEKLGQVSELCRKLRAGVGERDQRIQILELKATRAPNSSGAGGESDAFGGAGKEINVDVAKWKTAYEEEAAKRQSLDEMLQKARVVMNAIRGAWRACGETAPTPQEMPNRIESALKMAHQTPSSELTGLSLELTEARQKAAEVGAELTRAKKENDRMEARIKDMENDCGEQVKEMLRKAFQQKAELERKAHVATEALEKRLVESESRASTATALAEKSESEKKALGQRCKRVSDALDLTRREADGTRERFRQLTDQLVADGDLSSQERAEKALEKVEEVERMRREEAARLTGQIGELEVKLAEEEAFSQKLRAQLQAEMHSETSQLRGSSQESREGSLPREGSSLGASWGHVREKVLGPTSWDVLDNNEPDERAPSTGPPVHRPEPPASPHAGWELVKERAADQYFTHTGVEPLTEKRRMEHGGRGVLHRNPRTPEAAAAGSPEQYQPFRSPSNSPPELRPNSPGASRMKSEGSLSPTGRGRRVSFASVVSTNNGDEDLSGHFESNFEAFNDVPEK